MKKKSKDLNELKFSNNGLFYKRQKLKKARKIFNKWFFNNAINGHLN